MPKIVFTPNLARHVDCPEQIAAGSTVRELLDNVFADNHKLRDYILDDQDRLRQHMLVLVDGTPISDRIRLSDRVSPQSEVYVLQALSGG